MMLDGVAKRISLVLNFKPFLFRGKKFNWNVEESILAESILAGYSRIQAIVTVETSIEPQFNLWFNVNRRFADSESPSTNCKLELDEQWIDF